MAKEINETNIDEIIASGNPVVIDFWAEWCGPCRTIAPIVEELSKEYEGRVFIGKCDVDDNQNLATRFKIRNIPTLIFLKDGQEVSKHIGTASKTELINKIDNLLKH